MAKANRRAVVGPATKYLAGELRAQRARLEWTMDQLVEHTGVARGTAQRALSGESAIPAEILVALAVGMRMDIGELMTEASKQE